MTMPATEPARTQAPRCTAGVGIGLKAQHLEALLDGARAAATATATDGARAGLGGWLPDFVEVHAENYLGHGGPMLRRLLALREHYAVSLHGVGLSLGGAEPPDRQHLQRLRRLIDEVRPAWFSEHLAWSSHQGRYFADLLPLPYDRPLLQLVCSHVAQVQDVLGLQVAIENPSSYLRPAAAAMPEAEFLAALVDRTGCALLLDLTNLHVSAFNHGVSAEAVLQTLPLHAVRQMHLAGCVLDRPDAAADGPACADTDDPAARPRLSPLLIDHHGADVDEPVWHLYAQTLARTGPRPTTIERDRHVPPLSALMVEARRAAALLAQAQRNPVSPTPAAASRPPQALPSAVPGERLPASPLPAPRRTHAAQARFAHALQRPSCALPASHAGGAATAGPSDETDARTDTKAGTKAGTKADDLHRFQVHRNNVACAWIAALGESFPLTRGQLGPDRFDRLALAYARAHPPASPVLAEWGDDWPSWLAAARLAARLARLPGAGPVAAAEPLAALARLEWAVVRASHAADARPLDAAALAPWMAQPERLASLVLTLHPSVQLLPARWAVAGWWVALRDQLTATATTAGAAEPGLPTPPGALTEPETALVLRTSDDQIAVLALAAGPARLVAALQAGQPLGLAAADLAPDQVGHVLGRLLALGAVVGCHASAGRAAARHGARPAAPPITDPYQRGPACAQGEAR